MSFNKIAILLCISSGLYAMDQKPLSLYCEELLHDHTDTDVIDHPMTFEDLVAKEEKLSRFGSNQSQKAYSLRVINLAARQSSHGCGQEKGIKSGIYKISLKK